ncbi:hypothetical protein [uncultured Croceicoccus sp.]|uniref:hypothetical protein n=1 Tax=uncultured Croceicoccus sp. TaxID=1295329 RepID=UPI0026111E11|nr:hypothetical protein [uncultured Croceicoccus sp.]
MADYRNDIDWLTPALALGVWAAHFSLSWAGSSIFPGQVAARVVGIGLALPALFAMAWLWRRAGAGPMRSVPRLGIAIAATGVVFTVLPALFG